MGEYIRQLLTDRKQVHGRVAMASGMSSTNFADMLHRQTIGEPILRRVGEAMGIDLVELVRLKMDGSYADAVPTTHHVSAPTPPPYAKPAQHISKGARLFTIDLDEFDEETQLKMLRYLQQLPRKGEPQP